MEFHRLAPEEIDWEAMDAFDDRVFSQRRHWLQFVSSFVKGEVVVAALEDGGRRLGYFTGIRSRIWGVPVLGSPFRGWLTVDMGFNLAPDVPRSEALAALGASPSRSWAAFSWRSAIAASVWTKPRAWAFSIATGPPTCPISR
jgi:hypothetical protein